MTRPEVPALDTLVAALAAFDEWPPSGEHADRPEAQRLAEAARSVVEQYRDEQRRWDYAMKMARITAPERMREMLGLTPKDDGHHDR